MGAGIRRGFYINFCYIAISMLMPGCLLLSWLLDGLRIEGPHRFLRLLGKNSLEIYLLNVVFTREFDTLAPLLDHGPRCLFFSLSCWTLNILLGLALHRGIAAAKARLSCRREAARR